MAMKPKKVGPDSSELIIANREETTQYRVFFFWVNEEARELLFIYKAGVNKIK